MSTISAGNTLSTGFVQTSDTTGNLVFQTNGTTTALTLTTGQNANVVGSVSSVNTFGFKNRIINGGMTIDQRNAGASVTPAVTTVVYTLDRWNAYQNVASKFSVQQNAGSVTPPVGFTNYLGATSLSAYTVTGTNEFDIAQYIEGYNVADLAWGTANAKTVTLSAWVYSSLTGTFGGSVGNSNSTRTYPFTYSIPVANTWTQISVTIAGDTTGTWNTTTGVGINLNFSLGAGATRSGTAGTWAATNYTSATGATSVVGTNGATFYITGVQLEVGSQATSFDFRDYGRELILCQRYFTCSFNPGTAVANNVAAQENTNATAYNSGNTYVNSIYFKVLMRTAPTITYYQPLGDSAVSGKWGVYVAGWGACDSNIAGSTSQLGFTTDLRKASSFTSGNSYLVDGNWAASAEL